jgi:hypothetical protein
VARVSAPGGVLFEMPMDDLHHGIDFLGDFMIPESEYLTTGFGQRRVT